MLDVKMFVHPESLKEIEADPDVNRREIKLSKIRTYPILEHPPDPKYDHTFLATLNHGLNKKRDETDDALLYAVYRDAVHFLVTEDKGIHRKASRLSVKDRVLSIEEGVELFSKTARNDKGAGDPLLKFLPAYSVDINDPFFDSLKEDYKDFPRWWRKISQEARNCWVYYDDNDSVGALLIYKFEDEPVELESAKTLPRKKRVKISTLKVTSLGHKVGEYFIKLSVDYAQEKAVSEIYLTHYAKDQDPLVSLIEEYGFRNMGLKAGGEQVYLKRLFPGKNELKDLSAVEISKQFWPTFCDGTNVNKFIVPIRPEYHLLLFKEGEEQTLLPEHAREFITERNTIKKAYLSGARTKKIRAGDILLFYRSRDLQKITTLGVVENAYFGIEDSDEILKLVGVRSVYSIEEIKQMAQTPTSVMVFLWHCRLHTPLNLNELKRCKILKAAPQTIMQISHEKYLNLKTASGIDERFTIN